MDILATSELEDILGITEDVVTEADELLDITADPVKEADQILGITEGDPVKEADQILGITEGDPVKEAERLLNIPEEEDDILTKITKAITAKKSKTLEDIINTHLNDFRLNRAQKRNKILQVLTKAFIKTPVGAFNAAVGYLRSNWKSLLFKSAATGAAVGLAFLLYFATGSSEGANWGDILSGLLQLGIKSLPGILWEQLKFVTAIKGAAVSIKVVLELSKKNEKVKKFLNRKVSNKYLKYALSKWKVNEGSQTLQKATETLFNKIVDFSMSGVNSASSLLVFVLFRREYWSVAMDVLKLPVKIYGKLTASKKDVEDVIDELLDENDRVKDVVVGSVLDGNVPAVNKIIQTTIDDVRLEPAVNVSVNTEVKETLNNNKVRNYAGTVGLLVPILAVAYNAASLKEFLTQYVTELGPDALKKFGTFSVSTAQFIRDRPLIAKFMTGYIINKIGLEKAMDKLGIKTKDRVDARRISDLIKIEKSQTKLENLYDSFLNIFTGGKYYSAAELNKLSLSRLRGIYNGRNIGVKLPANISKDGIVLLIKKDMDEKMKRVSAFFVEVTRTILSGTVASLATMGVQGALDKVNQHLKDLEWIEKQKLDTAKLKEGFRKAQDSVKAAKAAEKELLKQRRLDKLASIRARDKLREAAVLRDLALKMDVAIADAQGLVRPLPPDEVILPKEAYDALDFDVLPLFKYTEKKIVQSSSNWLPFIGQYNKFADTVNFSIDVVEGVQTTRKVVAVLDALEKGTIGDFDPKQYDTFLRGAKLPRIDLTTVVEQLYENDKINMATMVRDVLKEGILEGWSRNRVLYEIGRNVLGKPKALEMVDELGRFVLKPGDTSFKVTNEIGSSLLETVLTAAKESAGFVSRTVEISKEILSGKNIAPEIIITPEQVGLINTTPF